MYNVDKHSFKKSAAKCKLQGVVTWYVIRPFTNHVQSGRRDEISFGSSVLVTKKLSWCPFLVFPFLGFPA